MHAPPRKNPVHGSTDASRTLRTAEDASAAQLRISTRHAGRGDANARLGPKRQHGDAPRSGRCPKHAIDSETPAGNGPDRHTRGPRARGCRGESKLLTQSRASTRSSGTRGRRARGVASMACERRVRPPRHRRDAQVGGATQRRQRIRPLRHITCAWGSGDRVHERGGLGYEAGNESAGGIDGTEAAGGGEPTAAAATAADKSAGGLIAVMASLDRDRGRSEAGRPALSPPTLKPWSPRARRKSREPKAPKLAPFCDSDHRQSSKFKLSTCAEHLPSNAVRTASSHGHESR